LLAIPADWNMNLASANLDPLFTFQEPSQSLFIVPLTIKPTPAPVMLRIDRMALLPIVAALYCVPPTFISVSLWLHKIFPLIPNAVHLAPNPVPTCSPSATNDSEVPSFRVTSATALKVMMFDEWSTFVTSSSIFAVPLKPPTAPVPVLNTLRPLIVSSLNF